MSIYNALGIAAVAAICIAAGTASGQTQVYPVGPDLAKQQQDRQQRQPLNNQPLWSEVRSGAPQTTTVVGRETNVLIQSEGQTWRTLRNSEISVYGGWGLVVVLLGIAAFYWRKGPIEVHEPLTGRRIRRFSPWERAIHWSVAISFGILAISGLIILFGKNLLLPLIGYTLFSWLAILSKNLHNFVGPVFLVCLVLFLPTFIRQMFPKAHDFEWLAKLGGMFSAKEVPSGKYNAGQKLWFWGGAFALGTIVAASGLVLDFANFNQTRDTMQTANVFHAIAASLFMMAGLGHIYLGTIGMRGAYDAMRYGYVDETWAKEHHEYWYNDIKAGRIPADERTEPSLTERAA
jgi:formate dehydrogenase subunit gamma